MTVKNAMEDIVKAIIAEHKDTLKLTCRCDRCLDDLLALSLNHLPPMYVVDDKYRPYVAAKYMVNTQEHANILTTITQASTKIAANPHCQTQKNQ
ncbi:late competence development ComFB family protein [Bacillus sp. REN10]|uniref:late competence development ComFB family protein n=1 Tax=Bacillus sp. REN10 TaxID=2782541 RepID=UPI00193C3470|nr:late competence development ComFB family protein [Bacillus sp. REN10]